WPHGHVPADEIDRNSSLKWQGHQRGRGDRVHPEERCAKDYRQRRRQCDQGRHQGVPYAADRDEHRIRQGSRKQRQVSDAKDADQRYDLYPRRTKPYQDDRVRHDRNENQEWPLDRGEKPDGIEINSLQIAAVLCVREDRRHDDGSQHLHDQLVEQLGHVDRAAVQTDGCKIENPCQKQLWRQIVEHVDDTDPARIEAKADDVRTTRQRRTEYPDVLPRHNKKNCRDGISRNASPYGRHIAVIQRGESDRNRGPRGTPTESADGKGAKVHVAAKQSRERYRERRQRKVQRCDRDTEIQPWLGKYPGEKIPQEEKHGTDKN